MVTKYGDHSDFTSDGQYRIIGTRPVRRDGVDKVTGRVIYGADVRLAALLHGPN
jgi:CO/xanthine dehydrogenase Mo-binding subunit